MVLGISRFRVVNGMEGEVLNAFLHRPRLVDKVPGFLGMETFVEGPAEFYLVTRWSDEESFLAWHKSPHHHQSHQGIPKGLKLDPSFTKMVVLHRLPRPGRAVVLEESVADAAPLFSRFLTSSPTVHFLAAASDGRILNCSEAVARGLKAQINEVIGDSIWGRMTEGGAQALKARLATGERQQEGVLINFLDTLGHPYTVTGWLDVHPDGFVVLGEVPLTRQQLYNDELVALNNEMSVLMRENSRQYKALLRAQAELEQAHKDLKTSHWHLRKIQEVLPICMECHKVKTGDSSWDSLLDYFKQNSNFLSHAYCPDCLEIVTGRLGL